MSSPTTTAQVALRLFGHDGKEKANGGGIVMAAMFWDYWIVEDTRGGHPSEPHDAFPRSRRPLHLPATDEEWWFTGSAEWQETVWKELKRAA